MTTNYLTIGRLKCFENIELRISNLTVFAGTNSVGKSTVTQAIRLFREASTSQSQQREIHLNGAGFLLGTYDEIINRNVAGDGGDRFEVGISDNTIDKNLAVFTPAEKSDECEYVFATPPAQSILAEKSPWHFIYLSAERYGPRLHQQETNGHRLQKVSVGSKGEFSAEVLTNNQTTRVDQRLIHPDFTSASNTPNALLSSNLEKWMSTIVGEINIRATRPPRLAMPMLEFQTPGPKSDWQFPTNHGFGISYTLPIVLAGLILDEGGFLIVDSPESHLHPAAQTAVASFLARVAASGRTVIVETHSDHIIDGFRLAIADPLHPLFAENSLFNYLFRTASGSIGKLELSPRPDGSLPKWPKGFFDQIPTNLRTLAELKRTNAT